MLSQVLRAIEQSKEPVSLTALSQKLNIEGGALEGMLAYWVRKGRLREKEEPIETGVASCTSGSCGSTCTGVDSCAFVARMPKVYSLAQAAKPDAISGQEDDLAA